jgi:hypothetical protein
MKEARQLLDCASRERLGEFYRALKKLTDSEKITLLGYAYGSTVAECTGDHISDEEHEKARKTASIRTFLSRVMARISGVEGVDKNHTKPFQDYSALVRWMKRRGRRWHIEFNTPKGCRITGADVHVAKQER